MNFVHDMIVDDSNNNNEGWTAEEPTSKSSNIQSKKMGRYSEEYFKDQSRLESEKDNVYQRKF